MRGRQRRQQGRPRQPPWPCRGQPQACRRHAARPRRQQAWAGRTTGRRPPASGQLGERRLRAGPGGGGVFGAGPGSARPSPWGDAPAHRPCHLQASCLGAERAWRSPSLVRPLPAGGGRQGGWRYSRRLPGHARAQPRGRDGGAGDQRAALFSKPGETASPGAYRRRNRCVRTASRREESGGAGASAGRPLAAAQACGRLGALAGALACRRAGARAARQGRIGRSRLGHGLLTTQATPDLRRDAASGAGSRGT